MRTLFIAILLAFTFGITGCKHPDTVQTHPHVQEDFGGDVEWHPHVKEHYSDFEKWATGGTNDAVTESAAE